MGTPVEPQWNPRALPVHPRAYPRGTLGFPSRKQAGTQGWLRVSQGSPWVQPENRQGGNKGLPGLIRVYPVPIRTYLGSVGLGGLPPCRSSIVRTGEDAFRRGPGYPYRSSIVPRLRRITPPSGSTREWAEAVLRGCPGRTPRGIHLRWAVLRRHPGPVPHRHEAAEELRSAVSLSYP